MQDGTPGNATGGRTTAHHANGAYGRVSNRDLFALLNESITALRAAEIESFTSDANSPAGLTLGCFRAELLRISQGLPLRADVIQRALSAPKVVGQ